MSNLHITATNSFQVLVILNQLPSCLHLFYFLLYLHGCIIFLFWFNKGHKNNGHTFPAAQCESTFLLLILQGCIKLHGTGKNQHDFVRSKFCQTNFFSFLFLLRGRWYSNDHLYKTVYLLAIYIICFKHTRCSGQRENYGRNASSPLITLLNADLSIKV